MELTWLFLNTVPTEVRRRQRLWRPNHGERFLRCWHLRERSRSCDGNWAKRSSWSVSTYAWSFKVFLVIYVFTWLFHNFIYLSIWFRQDGFIFYFVLKIAPYVAWHLTHNYKVRAGGGFVTGGRWSDFTISNQKLGQSGGPKAFWTWFTDGIRW